METIIFGDYTLQDMLIAAGIVIGILIVLSVVKKIFRKQKVSPHVQFAECKNCGWQGHVSKFAGRCPSCNRPLGDQRV